MDTKSGWQCSRCEKVASLCSVWYVCVMSWLPVHYFCQELVNPWMESPSWLHILQWFTAFLWYPVSRAWVVWANQWTEFKLFCLVFIWLVLFVIWHCKNAVLCFFIPLHIATAQWRACLCGAKCVAMVDTSSTCRIGSRRTENALLDVVMTAHDIQFWICIGD